MTEIMLVEALGPPSANARRTLPPNYPPLRALLSALSEEISELSGSYSTRLTAPFTAGSGMLNVETTYGFPSSGTLYIRGYKFLYEGTTEDLFLQVIHEEGFDVLDRGEVATSISPADKRGAIARAALQMKLETATGSMLDVHGMNHAVPRYFDIDDNQYRRLITVLAYMAGKGTQDSIELFLDTILDHKTICGYGLLVREAGQVILRSTANQPAFGSLLNTIYTRVEVAIRRPNGDIVFKTLRVKVLADAAPDTELFYDAILDPQRTRDHSSANDINLYLDEIGSDVIQCIWRIVPYRVWEDPYKRIEREQAVGLSPIAPPEHERQSVGNTVLVDLALPQENSSIGAGYLAGKLILTSTHVGGLQADNRLRSEGGQLRLYLEGDCVGFNLDDGLQRYLKTYPRQVLNVRRVVKSGSLASEQIAIHQPDVFYIPVGSNLCSSANNWVETPDGFYVVLDHNRDPELNAIFRNQPSEPVMQLQVDVGEVERPVAPHTAGFDSNHEGNIGVAGGVATAQIMPNVNLTNPSFLPPSVLVIKSVFPAVGGLTLEVNVSSDTGQQYTQRLAFPADIDFNDFVGEVGNITARSPAYILDFFYSQGYQVSGDRILGNRIFSHSAEVQNGLRIYLEDNVRSFVSIESLENDDVDNVTFGYTLPYVDPDPLVPRRRIDYYPLYLGERSVLLLSLLGDVITVAGVIPEVNTRTFQNLSSYQQSWFMLIETLKLRSL